MTSFNDLNLSKPLLKALNDLGLENPTPIQEKAFSVIMSGKDAVGIAQTGTGKTFAYLIPILRQLTYSEQRHPRVLIVVPTRELVVQVVTEIEKLSQYMSLRVFGVYGASNINTQKQKVYDGLDILVATPGRLIDLTLSRTLQFSAVKKLVIDEVDEMLNLGFRPQLKQILEVLPPKRQNLMFSATLTEDVEAMIEKYFNTPEYIEVITRGTPLEKIIQQAYHVPNFYTKVNLLKWLLEHDKTMTKVLLFVKNKKVADDLEKELEIFSEDIGIIHSNKSQPHRFNAVKQFQDGVHRLLIATDVIARGLDLKDVTHVINFDTPKDPSAYIHRIGRTGRADSTGIALSFITEKEIEMQEAIEALMDKKIDLLELPESVEISEELTADEVPVVRDKNLKKAKKIVVTGGAFHEKKAKNQKVQLGGKRRQEKQRRKLETSRSKRKR
ncbi:DEAD/DEAH box helicase [Aurantibacillus circumpalustris]|uniref:DEAD/DEAH box helicase n=1 Tax=Aurantibacillus circumpalustris TaxID=3036359 RepID=UPI00295A8999|nr:DEAD/DEAH box helicase [Aurantibacillus circumpalustris]